MGLKRNDIEVQDLYWMCSGFDWVWYLFTSDQIFPNLDVQTLISFSITVTVI